MKYVISTEDGKLEGDMELIIEKAIGTGVTLNHNAVTFFPPGCCKNLSFGVVHMNAE